MPDLAWVADPDGQLERAHLPDGLLLVVSVWPEGTGVWHWMVRSAPDPATGRRRRLAMSESGTSLQVAKLEALARAGVTTDQHA